ncbi:MAG: efflux RND transporter periplasmic adaptor subunit [Mangrovicoccus sp.]|nr:efflux RND transporter periplasmic adaptor subunit [Mangrovicoccus sp.]
MARFGLIIALVMGLGAAEAQQPPAGVSTDFVERRQVAETLPIFAQVVASQESAVAARVGGAVTQVPVRVGDVVAQGAVLARLDTQLLAIDLRAAQAAEKEAQAGVDIAQAGLLLAERGFARVDGLKNTNAFSQGQFDDREGALTRAQGELARAQAQLLSAQAALARAHYDYDRATIRAPFGGVVLELGVDPGEFIQLGAQVALLLDLDQIEVEAAVPAQYVANLSPGQPVTGLSDSGAKIALNVRAILPVEASATRTRPVRFDADLRQSGAPVAVGQSLTVNVPVTKARAVLLVPKDAVTQSRGAWTVYVHRDGKAVPQAVQIGASFGAGFEVLDGLAPGDEVVIRGNERLRPMQEIAPRPVREAPGGASASVSQ